MPLTRFEGAPSVYNFVLIFHLVPNARKQRFRRIVSTLRCSTPFGPVAPSLRPSLKNHLERRLRCPPDLAETARVRFGLRAVSLHQLAPSSAPPFATAMSAQILDIRAWLASANPEISTKLERNFDEPHT